ncbi:ubiquinol-cytochrome C reductase hinge protein-domain-containing protein [Nemania serpens]|nr:ubiquinol-cytochrome C reductase hinge protein-domain-containing protein [Nemania serpens]
MGVWDVINDLVEAAMPWSAAEAEAPPAAGKEADEESETKTEDADEEDDAGEEAEEEEEEEELEDPKEKFEEECRNSKQCAPAKHHFDECVERVTNASDDDEGEKEDCVEEFFHLAHCATQCAAPKLWSVLK